MIFQRCPNINIFYQTIGVSKSCLNALEELSVLSKVTEKIYVRAKHRTASSKYPKYWTVFSGQHTLLSLSLCVNIKQKVLL